MSIVESLWILIGSLVIFLILLTDPKSAARGLGNNELTTLFSSPRAADFGSVNKIKKITNEPIKIQRLSTMLIL
jgi:hypothetical protein